MRNVVRRRAEGAAPPQQLAYLAPAIQSAILDGRQPADLTLERIIRRPVPLDWDAQAKAYGFEPNARYP